MPQSKFSSSSNSSSSNSSSVNGGLIALRLWDPVEWIHLLHRAHAQAERTAFSRRPLANYTSTRFVSVRCLRVLRAAHELQAFCVKPFGRAGLRRAAHRPATVTFQHHAKDYARGNTRGRGHKNKKSAALREPLLGGLGSFHCTFAVFVFAAPASIGNSCWHSPNSA